MTIQVVPEWMVNLDDEDVAFIKRFMLASGSLKEVAGQYGVTYPTVRLRLDKLIQKIRIVESTANEPFVALIKRLAVNDKLDFDTAKILITEYKKVREEERYGNRFEYGVDGTSNSDCDRGRGDLSSDLPIVPGE